MPLSEIVGHGPLITLLRQAVSHNRVPQSLLFAGPEGVGKHAVAVALAQAVNCPRRQRGDGCGTCATCQRIRRGQHSDVTVLDRGDEASIKIRALRERVLESVNYRPFEASRRVFIIDPADAMTVARRWRFWPQPGGPPCSPGSKPRRRSHDTIPTGAIERHCLIGSPFSCRSCAISGRCTRPRICRSRMRIWRTIYAASRRRSAPNASSTRSPRSKPATTRWAETPVRSSPRTGLRSRSEEGSGLEAQGPGRNT